MLADGELIGVLSDCESAPKWDPRRFSPKLLINNRKSDDRWVPMGADRDPHQSRISGTFPATYDPRGMGPVWTPMYTPAPSSSQNVQ